jgi:hypothetical protein
MGQQHIRQRRIAQMNPAVLVNQQCARDERDLCARHGARAQRGDERCEASDEAPIGARKLSQIPTRAHQPPVIQPVLARRLEQRHVVLDTRLREARVHLGAAKARVPKNIRRKLAKTEPMQLFAQPLAAQARRRQRRDQDQRPAPVPRARTRCVDAPRGGGEAPPAPRGELVLARASTAARGEPTVLGEARDRSAHQPFGQSQGRRKANEAAKRHAAAARRDRIPEDGHKERAAAQRALAPEARAQGAQAGVDGVGHVKLRTRAEV